MSEDDMAAWMNAYSALWHPAALWGAAGPPRVESPYDYETPQQHHIYGVPESPPLMLSEDWPERVRQAGAVILHGTKDRSVTMEKAHEALTQMAPGPFPSFGDGSQATPETTQDATLPITSTIPPDAAAVQTRLAALGPEQVRPFFAIGLGYLLLSALSEAMEHENLLEREAFWLDVQRALAELAGVPYPKPAVEGMPGPIEEEPTLFSDEPGDEASLPATPHAQETISEAPTVDTEQAAPGDTDVANFPEVAEAQRLEGEGYNGYGSAGRSYYEKLKTLDPWYAHLHSAARRLQSAREVLYPVTIYLLDLLLLDRQNLDQAWPASFSLGIPLNIIASSVLLEELREKQPERFEALRQKLASGEAEVCGGCFQEREDNLLPIESQLWNLLHGQAVSRELLGQAVAVFARQRYYGHPQLPLFLSTCGLNRAILVPFDESAGPQFRSTVVSWPSPDGKQLDAFARMPFPADSSETFFNLGHNLHKTIREDHSATLAFLHKHKPAAPWYEDFLELGRFGPIFGEWKTFSTYFNQATTGEYSSTHAPDEFHYDYLSARSGYGTVEGKGPTGRPVSGLASHTRLRRRLETCWTLAAMQRGLAGKNDPLRAEETLAALEDRLERAGPDFTGGLDDLEKSLGRSEQEVLQNLGDRLLARATGTEPGYLLLNPCSFRRRVPLELSGATTALPIGDAIKACQFDGDKLLVVAEIPALGFAWIPRAGPPGTPPPTMRIRMADETHVRNEFLEAEIDPQTGGLHSIADRRSMMNRMSQRLVFNPGSTMKANGVKVTSTGPALGEIMTEGVLLGPQQQVLAKFRQRFRIWLGRPVLELRMEITPEQPSAGYPWQAYFGCRFAWGDERATLLRGINGVSYVTTHLRPQTPDFFEVRGQRHNTVILTGGLPFLRRHENRMVDVILMPQGETANVFELAVGLDREYPMQSALEWITPVPVLATSKGPPHVGASSWLYHLDTLNLLLTSMRPGGLERAAAYAEPGTTPRDRFDAITVRLLECGSQSGQAEFHCVRNPSRAAVLSARGDLLLEAGISGDAATIEVTPNDINQLQIEF
jgi:hypothetical protein